MASACFLTAMTTLTWLLRSCNWLSVAVISAPTVSRSNRSVLPLLSVHAGLCKSVVHDAEGSHTSGESVLTRAGAGLTRVPNGHL